MHGNTIGFSNNGAGLKWGNNYSQIYDNGNLYIVTDDYLNITAPTQLTVTSPNAYFSGNASFINVYCTTLNAQEITCNSDHQMLAYVNTGRYLEVGTDSANYCYIDFHSNDADTVDYDSRILSSGGTSTQGNGALNYYATSHSFNGTVSINGATAATQSWVCLLYTSDAADE